MAEHQQDRHLASHWFNLAMMLLGAVALTWMMRELGWRRFVEVAASVGAFFGLILALDLAGILLDAKALHTFMRPEARMISYWRVVAAQSSGRAVNIVTPFAALGEATKVTMLVAHAPRDRVLSAIVLYNLVGLYLSVAVILLGTPITLLLVDLPRPFKISVAIGLGILVPLMIALGVLLQRGALSTITGMLHRGRLLSAARRDAWRAHVEEIDRHLAGLHRDRRAGTWKGILWVLASRLLGWTATILLVAAVGAMITPPLVVAVLSVGILITWIASVVPLGLGLADGGHYVLFDLLGASGAHGAFVTMLNRARSALVALFGFLVMATVHTVNRSSLARQRRKLRPRDGQAPGA